MHWLPQSLDSPHRLLVLLATYPRRWMLPAAAVALLAVAYAAFRPDTWEASQALIVRNDAASNDQEPGKFSHTDEMKTVLETILELVKSRGVLAAALRKAGPPAASTVARAEWPSAEDVNALREAVKLAPPKGAEFGTTEVSYLTVRDQDRRRAIALAAAICDQLEADFQQLRDAKAQSMTGELVKAANVARNDLAESTARLTAMETQVGRDLAELRLLYDSGSGESSLRRTSTEIRSELRQVEASHRADQELLELLKSAQENPDRLVATPNELLQSQPALRRLKDGLIDAQLRTAQLLGGMSDEHPLVVAAKEAEKAIQRHLHEELTAAVRGIELELRLSADRRTMLEERLAATNQRLDQLAALRAAYTNQVAETKNRSQLLERAEQKLAEVRIAQATAKAASLIARIDTPDTGVNPVGPGRTAIALAGIAGGLLVGLGILVLSVPSLPPLPPAEAVGVSPSLAAHSHSGNGASNGEPKQAGAHALSLKRALEKISRPRPR